MDEHKKERRRVAGLSLIFATAIIWVVSSFISQYLVQPGANHKEAVPPFILTYLATSLFTLYLPFVYGRQIVYDLWRNWKQRKEQEGSPSERAPLQQVAQQQADELIEQGRQAHKQALHAAFWATPLWFFAQYAFNVSLALTSVTSNTILSSTSSLFTFGLAVVMLGERFTARKLACILMCILGTALFTFADTEEKPGVGMGRTGGSDSRNGASLLGGHDDAGHSLGHRLMSVPEVPGYIRHGGISSLGPSFSDLWASDHPFIARDRILASLSRSLKVDHFQGPIHTDSSSSSRDISGSDGGSSGQFGGGAGGTEEQADGPVQATDPLLGDFLVLVSSALYGAYTVVIRLQMPGEEAEGNVALFFGYLGLLTTVVLAPVVLLMVASGAVSLAAIPKEVYLIILLEGLLDYVLSDYLWARAVLLIGPTVATLGLSIQIPIAAVAELLSGADKIQWLSSPSSISLAVLGTAFILAGFVGINLSALVQPPSEALHEAEGVSAPVEDDGGGGHGRVSSAGESAGLENELGDFSGKGARDSEWGGEWESDKEGEEGAINGLRQQQIGGARGRGRLREESHKARGKGSKSRGSLGAVKGGVLHRGNSSCSLNGSRSKKGEEWGRGDEDLERGSG